MADFPLPPPPPPPPPTAVPRACFPARVVSVMTVRPPVRRLCHSVVSRPLDVTVSRLSYPAPIVYSRPDCPTLSPSYLCCPALSFALPCPQPCPQLPSALSYLSLPVLHPLLVSWLSSPEFCLVLSHPILSYSILSFPILSRPISQSCYLWDTAAVQSCRPSVHEPGNQRPSAFPGVHTYFAGGEGRGQHGSARHGAAKSRRAGHGQGHD